MISSIGKLLLTINRNGKILDIIELDKNIFNQPEGICFSKERNMFISNEGKNGGGNIVKFNLRTDSYNIKWQFCSIMPSSLFILIKLTL